MFVFALGTFVAACDVEVDGLGPLDIDTGTTHEALSIIAGYDLPTAPPTGTIGQSVAFDFVAPAEHSATDWVGIFPLGAANYQYLYWAYVPAGASGSVSVPLPTSAVDGQTYEARYFLANGSTHAATSPTFVARPAQQPIGYSLTAPATALIGASVPFNYVAPSGHSTNDWIGLYAVGAPSYQIINWAYVPASTSGTVSLQLPASAIAGQSYEARYYLNNGYTQTATSTSFVAENEEGPQPPQGYTVTSTPDYVPYNQPVTVSWVAPANHSTTDWIGLFNPTAADNEVLSFKYVGSAGATSGTMTFNLGTGTGYGRKFEVRYFVNNTYQRAAVDAFFIESNLSVVRYLAGLDVQVAPSTRHSPTDWVGLYAQGAADADFLTKQYVPANGAMIFTLPQSWTPTSVYELRYFAEDSFLRTGPVATFRKEAQVVGPELYVVPQAQIFIPWQAIPNAFARNKLGVFNANCDSSCFPWPGTELWVGNAQGSGTAIITLPANATGDLEIQLLPGGNTAHARSPFTVAHVYTVTGPSAPVVVGGQALGTWFASYGHSPNDWIGLYEVGAPSGQYKAYAYAGATTVQRGTVSLTVPSFAPPGNYEIRYFRNGGYDLQSTSATFQVTAN